jgi:hypothetical protein
MDVLHDLDGPCEYLVVDALEDVVGVIGGENAVGIVDVAGAEGFCGEEGLGGVVESELGED